VKDFNIQKNCHSQLTSFSENNNLSLLTNSASFNNSICFCRLLLGGFMCKYSTFFCQSTNHLHYHLISTNLKTNYKNIISNLFWLARDVGPHHESSSKLWLFDLNHIARNSPNLSGKLRSKIIILYKQNHSVCHTLSSTKISTKAWSPSFSSR
jgi:hypothetical protein